MTKGQKMTNDEGQTSGEAELTMSADRTAATLRNNTAQGNALGNGLPRRGNGK